MFLYRYLAQVNQFENIWLSWQITSVGITIQCLMMLICTSVLLHRLSRFNSIENMHSKERIDYQKAFSYKNALNIIIGLILIFLNKKIINFIGVEEYLEREGIALILFIIAGSILFDEIIFLMQKVILFLTRKLELTCSIIAQEYMVGNYKKIKSVIITFPCGIMIAVGLQSLYDKRKYN